MNTTGNSVVEDMFVREDKEHAPYEVDVLGVTYTVLPGVFSPKIRRNSAWYAEKIPPLLSGESFLEIGAGIGALAVRVAKMGYLVVATDIDQRAVENIALNATKHGVSLDVRLGSVYGPIREEERFDAIFWNHPWIFTEEKVEGRHVATYDQHYDYLREFISQAENHLMKEGQLLIGTGSLARTNIIENWAKEAGYEFDICARETQPLMVGGEAEAEFLIYRLKRILTTYGSGCQNKYLPWRLLTRLF